MIDNPINCLSYSDMKVFSATYSFLILTLTLILNDINDLIAHSSGSSGMVNIYNPQKAFISDQNSFLSLQKSFHQSHN